VAESQSQSPPDRRLHINKNKAEAIAVEEIAQHRAIRLDLYAAENTDEIATPQVTLPPPLGLQTRIHPGDFAVIERRRTTRPLTNVGQAGMVGARCTRAVPLWVLMKQLNLAEAKAKLSHLVDQAAKGKGVIIAKSGIPMAKLVPLDERPPKRFKFGTLKDVLTDELVEAIEAPLPDDILDAMLNGPIDPARGR